VTDIDGLPDDIRSEILEARAAKAKAQREAAETKAAVKREYEPMWARMANFRRYADEIGATYTLSLIPRGSTPKGGSR
jgi:hypothetical protein